MNYAAQDLKITVVLYEAAYMPFWRMLAHFDALDDDDDPVDTVVMGRYELLYPEDHWTMPDLAGEMNARLFWTFILGEDEYERQRARRALD